MVPTERPARGPDGFASTWERPEPLRPTSEYLEMIDELRAMLDIVAGSAPSAAAIAAARESIATVSAVLAPSIVDEADQFFGHISGHPGRGQTMSPRVQVDTIDDGVVTGRVSFGRYFIGGGGAVHGGAIPLAFDEVLGRLANTGGRRPSRTAYLHVDFRKITPLDRELTIRGWFEREEGRKRFLRGTLHDDDALCAEAEGLFVELLPGQP